MSEPFLSVAILNYRRRDALVKVLESLRTQSYGSFEIIVVDNGSGDGTPEFLRDTYPDVRVVALSGNPGCSGRNRGVEAAKSEIVVMLDNDVYLDSPFELQKVAGTFDRHPEAGCLVFKVLNHYTGEVHVRDWCHPRSFAQYGDVEFETWFIAEGACAFRRGAFLATGGYFEPFWIGAEGWDLALRLLDTGNRIVYVPAIRTRHMMSAEERTSWRPFYYYTRNYIWTAVRDYPVFRGAVFLTEKTAMMAWFSLRTRNLAAFFRGLKDGIKGIPEVRKIRRPVSRAVWRTLSEYGKERPRVWQRLQRHKERPLI